MKAELTKHILFAVFLITLAIGGGVFALSGGKDKLFALVDASTVAPAPVASSTATAIEPSLEAVATATPEKTPPVKEKLSVVQEVKKFFSFHSGATTPEKKTTADAVISTEQASPTASSPTETSPEPAAPKLAPITAQFVYLDTLLAGWRAETSSAQVNTKSPFSFRGEHGMQVSFTSSQGMLLLKNDAGVDTYSGGYDGLIFAIRGEKGGEKITLTAYDANGKQLGSVPVTKYLSAQKITTEYAQAYVPFRSLGAEKKVIAEVVFQGDAPGGIYLDEVSFTAQPSVVPVHISAHTTAPEVYADDIGEDWGISARDADWESKDGVLGTSFAKENASLTFHDSTGMDTYTYHHFVIIMKGWDALPLRLSVYDTNGVIIGNVSLRDYLHTEDGKLGDYQTISIPLLDLGADGAVLGSIVFWSDTEASNIYFSDIRFAF